MSSAALLSPACPTEYTMWHPPSYLNPRMRKLLVTASAIAGITAIAATPFVEHDTLKGFTPESSRSELTWEAKFQAVPSPARMRDAMKLLSARPHHVGSP